MRYISLFSGIGGLESREFEPALMCESDPACRIVLSRVHPDVPLYPDVRKLPTIRADICVAGWPCQDLTAAGRQAGIHGPHSSLFFEMVRIAADSGAETIVGENVPNLLRLRSGREFHTVISTLATHGYENIAWRSLNARAFGLPQDRERIVVVASRNARVARALHRPIPEPMRGAIANGIPASGFYWTGGSQSICFSKSYVPALKVGASPPKGGTSPVAVLYGGRVRKLNPIESLRLQGFETQGFDGLKGGEILRMAGNAVPRPMGAFAVDTAFCSYLETPAAFPVDDYRSNGLSLAGRLYGIRREAKQKLADDLSTFLDLGSTDSLSNQAAAGLLSRLIKSKREVPLDLFDVLYELSKERTKLRGTKVDSFELLHNELDPLSYRAKLTAGAEKQLELI